MSEDSRGAPRQRMLKGARIVINDGFSAFTCTVRNLSATGAQLRVAGTIGVPDQFRLVFDDGRTFECAVAWRRETELGVSFV